MWKIFLLFGLIQSCLAAPKPDELSELINSVFKAPPKKAEEPADLNTMIKNVFVPNKNEENYNNNLNTKPTEDINGEGCVCVPYYNCNANGSIQTDGKGLIDIRLRTQCDGVLETCCYPPDITDKPITPPPTPKKFSCGQYRPEGVGFRITGAVNNEASFGEFPWMVAVLSNKKFGDKEEVKGYECGGSLIHPSVVLTAAHCVKDKSDKRFIIRAGEWDTQKTTEPYPHQDRTVDRLVIHPNFKEGSLHNDFALLILSQPVELAENVDIACIPDTHAVFDNTRCLASGWGKNLYGKEGEYMVVLKKVDLLVVPHDQCQQALRNTRLGNYFRLDRSFICAGGEPGKDTCKGDGGSPLVCPLRNEPNRYVQAGIVSWGIGCGDNQIPGVYANVAAARSWIDEVLAYNNLDNKVYQYTPEYVF